LTLILHSNSNFSVHWGRLQRSAASPYLCSVVALALATAMIGGSSPAHIASGSKLSRAAPVVPAPPPLIVRDVSPSDAIAINARIPFSSQPSFPAMPFEFRGDREARSRALECLTLAVYYEAGNQDGPAQQAVAQVVLNRVRHPAFPSSICGVVFQHDERRISCQFTFTCDGALLRRPDPVIWSRAERVAAIALNGAVFGPVGLALNYHADYVVPYWATTLIKSAQVGAHIFYGWPDLWGMPQAFARRYTGNEPDPALLQATALLSAGTWTKGLISPDATISFAVDPRLELLSVVQHLADKDSPSDSFDRQYAKDVGHYFSPYKDDPAVQIFSKLSQSDPRFVSKAVEVLLSGSKPDHIASTEGAGQANGSAGADEDMSGFIAALRTFAASANFKRFFADHKRFYREAVETAEQRAGMARAYWEAYTRTTLAPKALVLATLRVPPAPGSISDVDDPPASFLSLSAISGEDNADLFLDAEARVRPLHAGHASARDESSAQAFHNDQLVAAVFTRIAALTRLDQPSNNDHFSAQADVPHRAGRPLERELRYYEAHQNQFPTWNEFMVRFSPAPPAPASYQTGGSRPSSVQTSSTPLAAGN
jgi:hypothetical protein